VSSGSRDGLIERQREMYAADVPFSREVAAGHALPRRGHRLGYQKMWFELQAMGWNDERVVRAACRDVHQPWVDVVTPAFEAGLAELGRRPGPLPDQGRGLLVVTFNQGVMLERLSGVDSGHRELLA
jgi:hypothetical protein